LPTPPLSAPTTITTGFAITVPYAPPIAVSDRQCLVSCFGREHGRNKGEFKALSRRRGRAWDFSHVGN
jgi:hypothetical protein